MSEASVSYHDGLIEDLADPEEAAGYLSAAIEDGDQEVFLLALRDVAEARGMSKVAREAGLNRENMYRMLSSVGNPQLSSLNSLLNSLGLRLAVEIVGEPISRQSNALMALADEKADYQTEGE